MPYDTFKQVWDKLQAAGPIDKIVLNSTGELYAMPDHIKYLLYAESNKKKFTTLQTNGSLLDYVPEIDQLVISFNGGTKETYEATTGLDFDETVRHIRDAYPQIKTRVKRADLHMLAWEGNKGTEQALVDLWADFPGHIRISYKFDNQHKDDLGVEEYRSDKRILCDYLGMVTIQPDGRIIACAHDFDNQTDFGNILTSTIYETAIHPNRTALRAKHLCGEFPGICKDCNYNTPTEGRIFYWDPAPQLQEATA